MRRVTALFATALFLGAHGLVPMLPPDGKASCSGKMACCTGPGGCSVPAACEAPAIAACHAGAGTAASGRDVQSASLPCLRALGCGHPSPSVVTPHLDPALFAVRVSLSAELTPTSLLASAQPLQFLLSEEPLSPPPRV